MKRVSRLIYKEWIDILPLLYLYRTKYIDHIFPYTEIISVPLFYGTFSDFHYRMKPP